MIATGYCQCGCGQETVLVTHTSQKRGVLKGQPRRYCKGHAHRVPVQPYPDEPNPSGLCQCGCGERTTLAEWTHRKMGYVKGKPRRFINGHQNTPAKPQYIVDDRTGCWNWNWCRNPLGYGSKSMQGKVKHAYVILWEQMNGPTPDGKELHHTCLNPSCVNPDHLEPVTHAVNMRNCHSTKLTENQVQEIRNLHAQGSAYKQLAIQFGITTGMVGHIIHRRAWADI